MRARRPCGGPARWARLADRFLASERVGAARPDEAHAPARYSTPELLATERELLAGAIERQAEGAGLVDEPIVEAVLAGRPELSDEQAAMVRGLTRVGRRPAGGAGAGRLGQDLRP